MIKVVIRKLKWSAVVFVLVLSLVVGGTLRTVGAPPNLDEDTYPDRIQLSQCIDDMKEVTQWDENKTKNAAVNLCEVRKAHAKEKAHFLAVLKQLHEQYKDATNHGFAQHLPMATDDAWTIVKSCIDFKDGFTSPHNAAALIIPERVRSSCYTLGSSLVEAPIPHP
jgi:hypothetical protein